MTFHFFITLVGVVSLASIQSEAQICREGSINRTPYDYVGAEVNKYDVRRSQPNLRIFTSLRITCDGDLTAWRFLARRRSLAKIHLGVFRRFDANDSFVLVGETKKAPDEQIISPSEVNTWIYIIPENSIRVKRGDYLGVFFDSGSRLRDVPVYYMSSRTEHHLTYENMWAHDLETRTIRISSGNRISSVPALTALVTSSGQLAPEAPRQQEASQAFSQSRAFPPVQQAPVLRPAFAYRRAVLPKLDATTVLARLSKNDEPGRRIGDSASSRRRSQGGQVAKRCLASREPKTAIHCDTQTQRAYFDVESSTCLLNWGCTLAPRIARRLNNFASVDECAEKCYSKATQDTFCQQPPTALSLCLGNWELRYYFDFVPKRCVPFQGCSLGRQLGNNFESLQQCQSRCLPN